MKSTSFHSNSGLLFTGSEEECLDSVFNLGIGLYRSGIPFQFGMEDDSNKMKALVVYLTKLLVYLVIRGEIVMNDLFTLRLLRPRECTERTMN